eukprot:Sspe_Gene.62980::Locus_35715_Transcript_1_1_Confidence_1.000_Length_1008::g.62980::m.62980/K03386/PRDX2_4, ahpC; peroxiredoxin (alkyl hydroperoxide reductase subunit C)
MNIPLLADITQEIGERYKVLTEDRVALRALFLIDPSRTLRHYVINDLPVGRNVDEVLRVLQAFKYHEENGDVMPCGWKPGAKTMKASSEGLKEYCQAKNGRWGITPPPPPSTPPLPPLPPPSIPH